jgi:hypothetical protein
VRRGTQVGAAIGTAILVSVGAAWAEGAEAKPGEKTEPAGEAKGEEGRLPLSYTERPLTLPRLVLNPAAEFNVTKEDDTFVNLAITAAFGITDDLQVQADVAPLQLSPTAKYGQTEWPGPSVGVKYRFLRGSFELGVRADVILVTYSPLSGAIFHPEIPARLHIGKSVRIDAAPSAYIRFISDGSGRPTNTTVGLYVPVAAAFDIIEPLHVGLDTGIWIGDMKTVGDTFAIPLGIFAGYAIGGKDGPILDIDPFFRWPTFATPALSDPNADKLNPGHYQVGLEVGGFFYL